MALTTRQEEILKLMVLEKVADYRYRIAREQNAADNAALQTEIENRRAALKAKILEE